MLNCKIDIKPLVPTLKKMNVKEEIEAHLRQQLGGLANIDLAAAEEMDNAIKASDQYLILIILISILFCGGLVIYRLYVYCKIHKDIIQSIDLKAKQNNNYKNVYKKKNKNKQR